MVLNAKEIVGLHVVTRSGQPLGKASGLELDTETGRLTALFVKTRGLVPGLMDHELSVAWNQIVEITKNEVVVSDAVAPLGATKLAMQPEATINGIHLSEHNEGAES